MNFSFHTFYYIFRNACYTLQIYNVMYATSPAGDQENIRLTQQEAKFVFVIFLSLYKSDKNSTLCVIREINPEFE
jgi:hypothetical protein